MEATKYISKYTYRKVDVGTIKVGDRFRRTQVIDDQYVYDGIAECVGFDDESIVLNLTGSSNDDPYKISLAVVNALFGPCGCFKRIDPNESRFPFSTEHVKDIEALYDHLFRIIVGMNECDIPMNRRRYNRIDLMVCGPLKELLCEFHSSEDPDVVYLTCEQIEIVNMVIAWANERRASDCV